MKISNAILEFDSTIKFLRNFCPHKKIIRRFLEIFSDSRENRRKSTWIDLNRQESVRCGMNAFISSIIDAKIYLNRPNMRKNPSTTEKSLKIL